VSDATAALHLVGNGESRHAAFLLGARSIIDEFLVA
jgi:hypothetical protein